MPRLTGGGDPRVKVTEHVCRFRPDRGRAGEEGREEAADDLPVEVRVEEELAPIVIGRERLRGAHQCAVLLPERRRAGRPRRVRDGLRALDQVHDKVVDRPVQRVHLPPELALGDAVERAVERAHDEPPRGLVVPFADKAFDGRLQLALFRFKLRDRLVRAGELSVV
jgi:hypothetical protein